MHTVAILAMHGVVPFDLATPCEVLGRLCLPDGKAAYQLRVCGEASIVTTNAFDMRVPYQLSHIAEADTVIVPGISDIAAPIPDAIIDALRNAAQRGARIASICSGAFVLAAAGLLDGLRATTHWLAAAELARRYPKIHVDPDVLFVDNGQILTSAGAAAGLDLCLHVVRRDYGAALAAHAARLSVMPLQREGGQAQFIRHEPPASEATLAPLLRWMEQQLPGPLPLEAIARHAAMSTRTLNRRFREQVGTTPVQWVLAARIRRAQHMLETTTLSIEHIASGVGFESDAAFRERFRRVVGTSPQAYRRAFGQQHGRRVTHASAAD